MLGSGRAGMLSSGRAVMAKQQTEAGLAPPVFAASLSHLGLDPPLSLAVAAPLPCVGVLPLLFAGRCLSHCCLSRKTNELPCRACVLALRMYQRKATALP